MFVYFYSHYLIPIQFIYRLPTPSDFARIPFWFKITAISMISLNLRNHLLQKYIKIS